MTGPIAPTPPVVADPDPQETREWLEALAAVLEREGPERAHFLLEALQEKARSMGELQSMERHEGSDGTVEVVLKIKV